MNLINVAHAGVISDAPSISTIGISVLNFLLSVVGIVAIMSLVVSGAMYFFSFGDEKRMRVAKRSAQYSAIGIAAAFGGMVLVKIIGQFYVK